MSPYLSSCTPLPAALLFLLSVWTCSRRRARGKLYQQGMYALLYRVVHTQTALEHADDIYVRKERHKHIPRYFYIHALHGTAGER